MGYKAVDTAKLESGLTAVADALRAGSGGTQLLSFPDGMAAEVDAVSEAGKAAGIRDFWDGYLGPYTRTNMNCMFSGSGWTADNFRPPFDMAPTNALELFYNTSRLSIDLVEHLSALGVSLDFSNCTNFYYCFFNSEITHVGVIDIRKAANTIIMFGEKIHTIDRLVVAENVVFDRSFQRCFGLVNLTVEGTIGKNGFDVSRAPLSKTSLTSIVSALSPTASGLTVTLRLSAVNAAFETAAGAADGSSSEEWLALAASKSNWTIALVDG